MDIRSLSLLHPAAVRGMQQIICPEFPSFRKAAVLTLDGSPVDPSDCKKSSLYVRAGAGLGEELLALRKESDRSLSCRLQISKVQASIEKRFSCGLAALSRSHLKAGACSCHTKEGCSTAEGRLLPRGQIYVRGLMRPDLRFKISR